MAHGTHDIRLYAEPPEELLHHGHSIIVWDALTTGGSLGLPRVLIAVAETPTRVRVVFSQPMQPTALLSDPAAYVLTPLLGSAAVVIDSVDAEGTPWPTYVFLLLNRTTPLTSGTANYTVTADDGLVGVAGAFLDPANDEYTFDGLPQSAPAPSRTGLGSVFKHPLRFDAPRYDLVVAEYTKVGNDYYATLVGTTTMSYPPLTEDPLDPDTDYWMGGGDPATDLLAIWETLGIGSMVLTTLATGYRQGLPETDKSRYLRCLHTEDTGGSTHYKVLWLDAGTTLNPALFGFVTDYDPAPQLDDGVSQVRRYAPRPPAGVLRLEYLPRDDSTIQTPLVVAKARTGAGEVETTFYGDANGVRVLYWDALFERVVVQGALDRDYSFTSLQTFLAEQLGPGALTRFYLSEDQDQDDYWQAVGTPPFTQEYSRAQRDRSRLKWQWRVELSAAT